MGRVQGRLRRVGRRLPPVVRTPALYTWSVASGQWPAGLAFVVQRWNTRNPRTFDEKVRYKMARDRRPWVPRTVDKISAKDVALSFMDAKYVPRVLATSFDSAGINWAALPRQFVCKVNHASGGIVVVCEASDPGASLPVSAEEAAWGRFLVHPDSLDTERLSALLDGWLSRRYGWVPGSFREWGYRDVVPQILVEEFYGTSTSFPNDVHVYCFNGIARSFITFQRDQEMEWVDFRRFMVVEEEQAQLASGLDPTAWRELVRLSAALASHCDQLRVDWLVHPDGGFKLGELTHYPMGGHGHFSGHAVLRPQQIDEIYGAYWTVPRRYR